MSSAIELFSKASELQFKQDKPEEAYAIYQQIVREYPNFEQMRAVRQMMATLEQEGLDFSILAEDAMPEEKRQRLEEEQKKEKLFSTILISSGFSFEGYNIVRYSGYISGDDVVQIPRSGLFDRGMNGKKLTDALVAIRRRALLELKEAAYNLGCNAIIGVDFDYITLEPQTASATGGTVYEPYVICVTANGNAVVIEKS